ncbi:hypothetical protein [Natronomonas sp. LN261]|uniref:hypothetical protein n=1 Tax=Natronomonas sp. LN261 TaxID=2750669 RepID=UPI0015EF8DAA|nr:hypothetical protein [Natronomonas sp. LN261]
MRRRVLLGRLAGGIVALAGCIDGEPETAPEADRRSQPQRSGPEPTTPADPDPAPPSTVTRIEAPRRKRVGVPFRLRIVVENTGEAVRTIERTVRDLTADDPVGTFSGALGPGERLSWESPPMTYEAVPASGTALFGIEETDRLAGVRIFESLHPRSSHTYDDGLRLDVNGVRILRAYAHEIGGERRWHAAADGSRFAFVFVSVSGVRGDDGVRSPPSRAGLSLRAGESVVRPRRTRYAPQTGAVAPSKFLDDRYGMTPTEDVPEYDPADVRRRAGGDRRPTDAVYDDATAAPDRTLWLAYAVPAGVHADGVRLLASR